MNTSNETVYYEKMHLQKIKLNIYTEKFSKNVDKLQFYILSQYWNCCDKILCTLICLLALSIKYCVNLSNLAVDMKSHPQCK